MPFDSILYIADYLCDYLINAPLLLQSVSTTEAEMFILLTSVSPVPSIG